MRVRIGRAYSGIGYLATAVETPGASVHGEGFDEAIVAFAANEPSLCRPDGTPSRLPELTVMLVEEIYGQYLLEVTRR